MALETSAQRKGLYVVNGEKLRRRTRFCFSLPYLTLRLRTGNPNE